MHMLQIENPISWHSDDQAIPFPGCSIVSAVVYFMEILTMHATQIKKWIAFPLSTLIALTVGLQGAIASENKITSSPLMIAQAQNQGRFNEGRQLLKQGSDQFKARQHQGAVESGQQALKIFQELGDREGMAWAQWTIGINQHILKQHQAAIAAFEQALPTFQSLKNRSMESFILLYSGISYLMTSQYPQAVARMEQSLPLLKAENDTRGEAIGTLNLSLAYLASGQYAKAIQVAEQSMSLHRALNDKEGEASAQKIATRAKQLLAQAK
jgi:tetratricopeptide (TPR) repeat protein